MRWRPPSRRHVLPRQPPWSEVDIRSRGARVSEIGVGGVESAQWVDRWMYQCRDHSSMSGGSEPWQHNLYMSAPCADGNVGNSGLICAEAPYFSCYLRPTPGILYGGAQVLQVT